MNLPTSVAERAKADGTQARAFKDIVQVLRLPEFKA
jgi:hypothetical protein